MSLFQKTKSFLKSQWFKDHIFQSFLIVSVLLISFIGLFFVQTPSKVVKGANQIEVTRTPAAHQEGPREEEPSPLPPEILESNRDQTNSVVLGAILLVLIIIIGTLRAIRTANKRYKG